MRKYTSLIGVCALLITLLSAVWTAPMSAAASESVSLLPSHASDFTCVDGGDGTVYVTKEGNAFNFSSNGGWPQAYYMNPDESAWAKAYINQECYLNWDFEVVSGAAMVAVYYCGQYPQDQAGSGVGESINYLIDPANNKLASGAVVDLPVGTYKGSIHVKDLGCREDLILSEYGDSYTDPNAYFTISGMKVFAVSGDVIVNDLSVSYGTNIADDEADEADFDYRILNNGTIEVTGYHGYAANVPIPATFEGLTVKTIGSGAFDGCTHVQSVAIPADVTTVKADAFADCAALGDVYFGGSESDWTAVSIAESNDPLTAARIHYGTMEPHWGEPSVVSEKTCTQDGEYVYTCPCGHTKTEYIPATGHSFQYGACENCSEERMESAHPYKAYADECWIIQRPDAVSVSVTFSADTYVESGYDYLSLYDANDNLIGYYTGSDLAGRTITVDGDMLKICLSADGSGQYYGFAVTDIQAKYDKLAYRILDNGTAEITALLTKDTAVVIPKTIGGFPVTSIGAAAFANNKTITSLTLPVGVTNIGEGAFENCNALADVYYGGNESQWNAMTVGEYNYRLFVATRHYSGAESALVPGDWDGDGVINTMDALNLFSLFMAGELPADKTAQMDMNGDEQINMMDCLFVFNIAAGQE